MLVCFTKFIQKVEACMLGIPAVEDKTLEKDLVSKLGSLWFEIDKNRQGEVSVKTFKQWLEDKAGFCVPNEQLKYVKQCFSNGTAANTITCK